MTKRTGLVGAQEKDGYQREEAETCSSGRLLPLPSRGLFLFFNHSLLFRRQAQCQDLRKRKQLELQILSEAIQGWEGEDIKSMGDVVYISQVLVQYGASEVSRAGRNARNLQDSESALRLSLAPRVVKRNALISGDHFS